MDRARKTALCALDTVFKVQAYSNITLDNALNAADLSDTDRRFASRLFYGVLDRKITLDYVLSKFLKSGISKTPLTALNAMRMALYQIKYMDKVPDFAAVNSAVQLVKNSKQRFAAPTVNGVLRNVLRQEISLPEGNGVFALSVRYSCPEYIVKGFIEDYGTETAEELLKSFLTAPDTVIRVNTLLTDTETLFKTLIAEGLSAEKCDIQNALIIKGGINVSESRAFKDGLFHIEDSACQKAVEKLAPRAGEKVLDVCSAPGGKAFTMAEMMNNTGSITACDIYPARVGLIRSGAERLKISIINTLACNSAEYKFKREFDAALCDVPCSGLGVLRRKPEIKYKEQPAENSLPEIQLSLLENADAAVVAGGRIMYSTCTLRRAENEGVVAAFLDKHKDYELIYEHTFMPHTDGTDGFFCALIQKSR